MLKSALLIEKKLNREEYLRKEREHKCLHHSKLKADPKAYKESLKKDRHRKKMKATTPAQSTPTLPQDMEMTPNQGQTVTPNQACSDSNSTTPPFFKKKKKNFMAPFYGWGSTASRPEPLRGGSLLFTTKFPEVPGTHFIDLGRMKG